MSSLDQILVASVITLLIQIGFGASEFTCYSCIGDQDSLCATDPANANYSHFGGEETGELGSFNSSTIPCTDALYCISLVIDGEVKGVATEVYYRSCIFDCDVIQVGFDAGASSLIPDGVLDNAKVGVCDSCRTTNCNSKNYSEDGNNSAVVTEAILFLMIFLSIVCLL